MGIEMSMIGITIMLMFLAEPNILAAFLTFYELIQPTVEGLRYADECGLSLAGTDVADPAF